MIDHIEAAALAVFVRRGFTATTIRDIASEAGLSIGALYNHYKGKAELFSAVVAAYKRRLAGPENPVTEVLVGSRFPDDLDALAAAVRTLIREHREYWLLWYVDVIEFEGQHFQSALDPQTLLAIDGLAARLDALDAAGTLRIPARQAFLMVYMHLFNFFLVEELFGGEGHYGVPAEQAVALIRDTFVAGLFRTDPRTPR